MRDGLMSHVRKAIVTNSRLFFFLFFSFFFQVSKQNFIIIYFLDSVLFTRVSIIISKSYSFHEIL